MANPKPSKHPSSFSAAAPHRALRCWALTLVGLLLGPRLASAQDRADPFVDDPWQSPRVTTWLADRGVAPMTCEDRLFWGLALEEQDELVAAASVLADCSACSGEQGQACREAAARVVGELTALQVRLEGVQRSFPPGATVFVDGVPRPDGVRQGFVLVPAGPHRIVVQFADGRIGHAELDVPHGVRRLVVPILPRREGWWPSEDIGAPPPSGDADGLGTPWVVAAISASLGGASGVASLATFVASRGEASCPGCGEGRDASLGTASTGLLVGAGVGAAVGAAAALFGLSTDPEGRIELGAEGLRIAF